VPPLRAVRTSSRPGTRHRSQIQSGRRADARDSDAQRQAARRVAVCARAKIAPVRDRTPFHLAEYLLGPNSSGDSAHQYPIAFPDQGFVASSDQANGERWAGLGHFTVSSQPSIRAAMGTAPLRIAGYHAGDGCFHSDTGATANRPSVARKSPTHLHSAPVGYVPVRSRLSRGTASDQTTDLRDRACAGHRQQPASRVHVESGSGDGAFPLRRG
jgi:hypothetical protein